MSCGCSSTPCGCNTPNIPRGPRGYQGPAGPAPSIEIGDVSTGPAAATISGTSPNLVLDLTIPPGVAGPAGPAGSPGINGVNGVNAFTSLTSPFVQPAPGGTATITVGNTSWMSLGSWLYIAGGGWYIVASNPLSSTQIVVKNPGAADLAVIWPGGPTSIPQNAAATSTITPSGFSNQVQPAGIPGVKGADGNTGTAGQSALVRVLSSVPLGAPAPGQEFIIVTDNPITPTSIIGYSWNGSIWNPTVNFTPTAGSQIYLVSSVPLAGFGNNGDWAFNSSNLEVYYKVSGSWTNPFDLSANFQQVANASLSGGVADMGTIPVQTPRIVGFEPVVTSPSPATYTMDLAYQAHDIERNNNITLDWDDTNFPHSGVWELQVTNTLLIGTINLNLTAGKFAENANLGITPPTLMAIPANTTILIVFRKNRASNRLIIENYYEVNNL